MSLDWQGLKSYIQCDDVNEDTYIEECFDVAVLMVNQAFSKAFRPVVIVDDVPTVVVPPKVLERCYLEVGNELFNRKNAPSGGTQFAVFDGGTQPVRGPRDPMRQIRPIIRQYVVSF